MRKQIFGRQFKRDKNERKALFRGLISAMVMKGSITTTEEKAKAIRPDLEKLVTKAKKGDTSRRLLQPYLSPFEISKMINEIAPAFKDINGGYTRIIKTGRRFSDNASMATIQWTQQLIKAQIPQEKKTKKAIKTKVNTSSSKTAKSSSQKAKKSTARKSK